MKRRAFITLIGGAAAYPLAAHAQQFGRVRRIGALFPLGTDDPEQMARRVALRLALENAGWSDGRAARIDYRHANGPDEFGALAKELVALKPDIIFAQTPGVVAAFKREAGAIPIVFVNVSDPIGAGFVASLARPGGNITGLSSIAGDLSPKRLELLFAMTATVTPKVSRVAMLVKPSTPATLLSFERTLAAGKVLGVAVQRFDASTPQEIDNAFTLMQRDKIGALMVPLNPFYEQQKDQLGELSIKRRVPCMSPDRMYAEAGCLMSYGTSLVEMFRQAATYVDKILKGAKPADLPVEMPTRLELVINGKTAKALGLVIPKELLLQANRVIE